MGSRLPSAREVLIIRPAGKKGQPPQRSNRVALRVPGRHSKARSERHAVQAEGSKCVNVVGWTIPRRYFPRVQGAILMKKILLSVVLGATVVAVGQNPAPPAQGQPAAPSGQQPAASQAPVIKDPAEYNAYVAAVQQKDANAKISGLEAFLTQYPNSVMKNQALEILLGTYQQAGNVKKTMETATKLVA